MPPPEMPIPPKMRAKANASTGSGPPSTIVGGGVPSAAIRRASNSFSSFQRTVENGSVIPALRGIAPTYYHSFQSRKAETFRHSAGHRRWRKFGDGTQMDR